MNLAILHYHLNRGGVTRVIANQLAALDSALDGAEPWRAAVIYGGRHEGWDEGLAGRLRSIRLSLCAVPSLDYEGVYTSPGGDPAERLHAEVSEALRSVGFDPHETVLHVHNHTLGKNLALPPVLARLAADGYRLLTQIHDFAEDFRPVNYRRYRQQKPPAPWASWPEVLYLQGPGIHYAVLNGRDHAILGEAGVAPERLHLLPNPVDAVADTPSRSVGRTRLAELFGVDASARYMLYPVRCIRRKNVGEALLLSTVAPPGSVLGLTLPPLNPAEQAVYQVWKRTVAELRLPCLFEVGGPGRLTFGENLAAADLLVSTSLAEGFGMVFLEAWPAGLPLVGRNLPEVTADFASAGIRFDGLADRLLVPLEWIGAERFVRSLVQAYRRALEAYRRDEPCDTHDALEEKTARGMVDFGDLDEPLQQQVIRTVLRTEANRRRLLECNPALEPMLSVDASRAEATIDHNAQIVRRHYAVPASGQRLLELYEKVAASAGESTFEPLPHPERILDRFLDLRRFRMIRG